MSQSAFLRDMDATIVGAFTALGAADVACWASKRTGRSVDNVPVLVDRAINLVGIDGGVPADSLAMSIFAADIGQAAEAGDRITFNGSRYKVGQIIDRDESRTIVVLEARD